MQNLGVRPCRSCLLVTAARTGKRPQIPLARRIQRVCDAAVAPLRTSSITLSNHGSLRGKVGGLETRSRQGVSSTESLTRGLLTGKPESASQQANTTRLGTAIAGRMSRPNCKGSASTDAHGVHDRCAWCTKCAPGSQPPWQRNDRHFRVSLLWSAGSSNRDVTCGF